MKFTGGDRARATQIVDIVEDTHFLKMHENGLGRMRWPSILRKRSRRWTIENFAVFIHSYMTS